MAHTIDVFTVPKKSPFAALVSPGSLGVTSAILLAARPSLIGFNRPLGQKILSLPGVGKVPAKVYAAILGLSLGVALYRCLNWLRKRILRKLLQYDGWVYQSSSAKTKTWALLVKILRGFPPFKTYQFQDVLPRQPLPDLKVTMDKWVAAAKNFLTEEEYECTKIAAEEFLQNEGQILQKYLRDRAKSKPNWLSDYWLQAAYLSSRDSLAINSNYYLTNGLATSLAVDQLTRAATQLKAMAQFHDLLTTQSLQPTMLMDLIPLCMNSFRYLYNTVRLPGEHIDNILQYPGYTHAVVMRRKTLFKLDLYAANGKGRKRALTVEEIKIQLERICAIADENPEEYAIADLTAQKRAVWAKHRELLARNNKDPLHIIESAMFMFSMDHQVPKDIHEGAKMVLAGTCGDRWFDKCFNGVMLGDASGGANVEHSVIDATVFTILAEFMNFQEHYHEGKIIENASVQPRQLQEPERLKWNVSGLEEILEEATRYHKSQVDDLDLFMVNWEYGKGFMKSQRMSPDGYIQMVLQLAYYRMHKEFPKTYEPSTGRCFLLGRTETVHPTSPQSIDWVRAMDDPSVSANDCVSMLRQAIRHQNKFRLDATVGRACDRHLLGLYCASMEMGMDAPRIFRDKAWQMNFKLSTSQTPTRMFDIGVNLNWKQCTGGFGPSCHDGYGISYIVLGDEFINMPITSWKSCGSTDSKKLGQSIFIAMADLKELLLKV